MKQNPRSAPHFTTQNGMPAERSLEKELIKACLKLIEHTGSDTFKFPLDDSDPQLFIRGDAQRIRDLLADEPPRDN